MVKKTKITDAAIADLKKTMNELEFCRIVLLPIWNMDIILILKDGPKNNEGIKRGTAIGKTKMANQVTIDKIKLLMNYDIIKKVDPPAPYVRKINALTDYGLTLLPKIEILRAMGEELKTKLKCHKDTK